VDYSTINLGLAVDSTGIYIVGQLLTVSGAPILQGYEVSKYDFSGNKIWNQIYNDYCNVTPGSFRGPCPNDLSIDDDNVYIAGFIRPTGSEIRALKQAYDKDGNLLWTNIDSTNYTTLWGVTT